MSRIFIVLILLFSFCFNCFGQVDTIVKKQQKGFLFLTNYNFQYDAEGLEVRSLGFHDFYFPAEGFDTKLLLDSNINIVFKNGIRIDFINNRKSLKEKAVSFSCIDTSKCYSFGRFYIIPVIIDYKIFKDYEPLICYKNYFELQVINGGRLRFDYFHKAMIPIRISPVKWR